jgi:hypothetical protein
MGCRAVLAIEKPVGRPISAASIELGNLASALGMAILAAMMLSRVRYAKSTN